MTGDCLARFWEHFSNSNGVRIYGHDRELLTPLFLTAGAVIHALANEQDIRKFGGLQQVLIFSYTALLIGTLALVGTPFLTGFYSKDVILEFAYARYNIAAHFSYALTCLAYLPPLIIAFGSFFFVLMAGALKLRALLTGKTNE